jgi:hypothetical protein
MILFYQPLFQHKARNLLKRVAKMEMSHVDGEDFEKANLFLAKFYVDKVCYSQFCLQVGYNISYCVLLLSKYIWGYGVRCCIEQV